MLSARINLHGIKRKIIKNSLQFENCREKKSEFLSYIFIDHIYRSSHWMIFGMVVNIFALVNSEILSSLVNILIFLLLLFFFLRGESYPSVEV